MEDGIIPRPAGLEICKIPRDWMDKTGTQEPCQESEVHQAWDLTRGDLAIEAGHGVPTQDFTWIIQSCGLNEQSLWLEQQPWALNQQNRGSIDQNLDLQSRKIWVPVFNLGPWTSCWAKMIRGHFFWPPPVRYFCQLSNWSIWNPSLQVTCHLQKMMKVRYTDVTTCI